MFKFALFLVVAVVSVQGFVPQKGHAKFEKLSVPKIVEALMKNVDGNVDDLMANNKNLIEKLTKKSFLIAEGREANIKQSTERIQKFVSTYEDAGNICLIQLKPDLDDIIETSRVGYGACSQFAIDGLMALVTGNGNFGMQKIVEFYQIVIQRVLKCVVDNEATPLNLDKCLRDLVPVVQEDFESLKKLLTELDASMEADLAKLQENIFLCTSGTGKKVFDMEDAYIENFFKCIADHQ